jgi:myo-inositol 2-dehydrogenase/D-chiro-inositol 1-dehydrogenase
MERVIYSPGLKRATEESDFKQVPLEEKWGYVEEDRLFIDAILSGTKPPVTAEDGYLLSRLLDGIYESAKTGNQLDFFVNDL